MFSYNEAVNWLFTRLPMFQRIGAAAYKADLTNTIKLCGHFGNPQNSFPSVHIAGTNGKGSTSHMLASVLQKSGYKVGLYTSPHLKSFTERIKINGQEISEVFVAQFVEENKDFFSSFDPSFFEITVALAFEYFKKEKVDIAVIETGLGGRLDSTNIITPLLSVITNIGWDHQQLLGDTLEKIASEKAGIIKPGVPVVIGEIQENSMGVFMAKAEEVKSPIIFADNRYALYQSEQIVENNSTYQVLTYNGKNGLIRLETDLLGSYQRKNCKAVLTAIDQLKSIGFGKINNDSLLSGFKEVSSTTGLKGRWQILGNNPLTIADTGHNINGIEEILKQLSTYTFKNLRMVLGFVNDKSISEILQLLPKDAHYYFSQASIPRAKPGIEVYNEAVGVGLKGDVFPDLRSALTKAQSDASFDDLIFIGGSTFVVAELIP